MATVLESLRKSSINIQNISQTLSDTKKSTSAVNNSVENISRIVATNTRIKRELFTRSNVLNSRREEASKRQELEDQIESTRVSTSPRLGLSFSSRSEKGPLGRILGFLGFTFAGWIVENLPTWIFMGKEFISRIQTFGRSMFNMVSSMQNIIKSFGDTLKYSFDAIIRLDFDEFAGEGTVARSFEDLNLAVQGLGNDITETFRLFTTPLTESLETGEQAPGLGETRPDTMFPSGEGLTSEEQALISTIKKREGTAGSGGYNKFFGGSQYGGDLSQRTVMEVAELQKKFLREGRGIYPGGESGVVGAGQFKYPEQVVMAMGLDPNKEKFTPELQNKMILFLARKRGIDPKKPLSKKDLEILNKEWSGLGPFYGQNKNTIEGSLKIYQQELKTFKQSSSISTQTPQSPPTPSIPVNPMIGDRLGAGRGHGGVDLQVKQGTPLRAVSDGVIVDSDYEKGWGNFLVMKDNMGIYHLYGHMQSGYKRGGPVKKGEVIGKVGMTGRTTGPHLHWETGTGWTGKGPGTGGVITGRFDALTKYSKFAPFNTQSSKDNKIETPAQISAQPKAQQPAAMTPERKGSQILFIGDTQPQQPQASYQSQQPTVTPTISEFKLLNNFIKNKLLLDLAYL